MKQSPYAFNDDYDISRNSGSKQNKLCHVPNCKNDGEEMEVDGVKLFLCREHEIVVRRRIVDMELD